MTTTNYFTFLPIGVSTVCYLYSWCFYKAVLGRFDFIVGIQDHILKGASAFPLILLAVLTIGMPFLQAKIDPIPSLRSENPPKPLTLDEFNEIRSKYNPYKHYAGAFLLYFLLPTLGLVAILAYSYFLLSSFYYEEYVLTVIIILFPTVLLTSRFWQKLSFENPKILVITLSFIFIAGAAALGFENGRRLVNNAPDHTNAFTVAGATERATYLAAIGSYNLIRLENDDYILRSAKNEERILLFNRPRAQKYSFFRLLLGLVRSS